MNRVFVVAAVVNFLAGILELATWSSGYHLTAAFIFAIGGFLTYTLGRVDGSIAMRNYLASKFHEAFQENLNNTEEN